MRFVSMPQVKHALPQASSMLHLPQTTIARMRFDELAPTDLDLSTLGGRVGFAVRSSSMPVEAIADRMGITKQAIYQWIDGRTKNIKNEYLFAFADITDFNARWIATGSGPDRPPRYEDRRVQHMLRVMESLPDYAIDGAVKDIDTLAELIEKSRTATPKREAC